MPVNAPVAYVASFTDTQKVRLFGRIDSANAAKLEEQLIALIQAGVRDLTLDCSAVTYITGTGMAALQNIARFMAEARGNFALCAMPSHVHDVFKLCGLEGVIAVVDDSTIAGFARAA